MFNAKIATRYKASLLGAPGRDPEEGTARSTIQNKLSPLQGFFTWLGDHDGFRRRISFGDVEYLNVSNRDVQIARDTPANPAPAIDEVHQVIEAMPAGTAIELRDRVIVCCTLLGRARMTVMRTLRLRHVRADCRGIDQDARQVRTKRSWSSTTTFMPVGADIRAMSLAHVEFLRVELGWRPDDPLFQQICAPHAIDLVRLLGANVRKARKAGGLSQERLALEAGMKRSTSAIWSMGREIRAFAQLGAWRTC